MYTEEGMVTNLRDYLMATDHDVIRIRSSFVEGCWYDNEFDAHRAGFSIYRYIDKEYVEKHEFAECYRLTRKH